MSQNEKLAFKVLKHMKAYHGGSQAQSILLTGAPGIGKTTFSKIFGELVGMQVIIIEIPHITEEHMINIPFIVFNPDTNTTKPGNIALQDDSGNAKSEQSQDYKLVLAQSNLYTQLINGQPIPDAKYLQDLAKAPAYVQEIFKNLGGTETTIPHVIQGIRGKYKNILFLDEFFRSTTMRIRNILRGLLNHEIGMHRLPSSTYVMYASNMSDTGGTVDETPNNFEFKQIEYKRATNADWFKWLEGQCKTKYHIQLNESMMKKFKKALKEEDLSYEDINAEVRTSPRRWEQILLYINSSLPVENRKEAQALITNIKNNFIHYKEGKYSDLSEKVVKAVSELIKETSNLDIAPEDVMPEEDWKDQLNHMVQQQMKLGEHRKHIPVVSGPPGIGKDQPLTSKIKTPTGWTTMGEIKIGDFVSTPDGKSALVSGVFPQGEKQVYKITFSDGRTVRAGGGHLWKIRKIREPNWCIVTTLEMQRIIDDTNQWIYIPVIQPEIKEDIDLPIDSYTLGCLIGDGSLSKSSFNFSSNDPEILESITSMLKPTYSLVHQSNYDYRIASTNSSRNGLTNKQRTGLFFNHYKNELNKLNLLGTNSYTKFIPEVYKTGSVSQKEQLIAGLVDTDGYVNKQGALSISTTSKQLALDIQEVVRSIGGHSSITSRTPSYAYLGEKKFGALAYNVSIRYSAPRNLSRLSRKIERLPENYQYADLNLRVTSVEQDGVEQTQCILVDHSDHLYITDNYVVTHNTTFAHDVALKNNLRLITVSCDNLQPDDVIGMPIPGNKVDMNTQGSDIKVQFSTPVLYQRIMSQIKQADEKYEQKIRKDNPTDAKKVMDQYQRQKYKYLIFFDELNRVGDERTFNGLRKVMLDKDFGPAGQEHGKPLELPKSAIVVGAINPTGTGTQELTHHFRDVVDFIPAQANWQDIRKYIRGQDKEDLKELSPQTKDASMGLIDAFVDKFKSKDTNMSNKRAAFHLDIGGTDVYMSPREYTGLYSSMAHDLDHAVKQLLRDPEITSDKLRDGVDEAVFEAFEENLNFPFEKAKYEKEEFMATLKNWIHGLPIETFSGLITTKLRHKDNLASVLGHFLDGRDITHMPEEAQVTNLNDSMDNAEVVEQFRDCLQDKLVDADSIRKYVNKEDQPKVVLKGNTLQKDASAKVSLFTNTVLGLLYTLHINKYKNDRIMIIGKAANKAYGEVVEKLLKNGKIDEDLRDQAGEQVLTLRSEISDLMANLK